MSLTSTLAPIGFFACSIAAIFSTFDASAFDEKPVYHDQFSQKDFAAFDRSFDLYGSECTVGIERKRICFQPSPLEEKIEIGKAMPQHAPVMPATIPVLLRTSLKPSYLTTHRYGRTLVLIEDDTGIIVDKLDLLGSDDGDKLRRPPVQVAQLANRTSHQGK